MASTRELVLYSLALPTESNPSNLYLTGSEDLSVDPKRGRVVGRRIDLGTWFNAAPVGWWRSLFGADSVTLRVQGEGNLKVWGASKGERILLSSVQLDDNWSQSFDLIPNIEFMWIEVSAIDQATLNSIQWSLSEPKIHDYTKPARVSVVVPTYGLEEEALKQVRRLLAPDLQDVVARVLVIDQGNSVASSPNFASLVEEFDSKFELIEQGNFGGSGGYARGMIESLRFPDDAVLLLDDDAVIEPESLRRALVLSESLGRDKIVGTGLISAELPTTLASLSEGINLKNFHWGPADGVGDGQELTRGTPDQWIYLSSAAKTEYSGWWGTLLPAGAVQRIGLPAPFFLKWDDAEYGLRASTVGIQTVTLPGISAWHPTWAAKGTVSSWSSWPMHRNRLTVAAAHGAGRGVIWHSLIHQIKHVLSLQYASAELWNKGIEEFTESADWLTDGLLATRPKAQQFLDSIPRTELNLEGYRFTQPKNTAFQTVRGVVGLFTPVRMKQIGRSEGIEYSWSKSIGMDAYVVDRMGRAETLLRDPKRARAILARTLSDHLQLFRRWGGLRLNYAKSLPAATTQWNQILGLDCK